MDTGFMKYTRRDLDGGLSQSKRSVYADIHRRHKKTGGLLPDDRFGG